MTEDKDLERAATILIRIDDPEEPNAVVVISNALREERQRLLNDPRIKELVRGTELISSNPLGVRQLANEILNDFESLLKENEEGKP